jgi:hypothetical protein
MCLKWDIKKFTGSNEFVLWKVNMRAILIQHRCVDALKGEAQMHATLTLVEKTEMNDKALSAIILSLGDKVLREVARETTAVALWIKLESLYMSKYLAHRQCLKQQLYFYRMMQTKSILEQLTKFNKIIDDLANIDVTSDDEDKALHPLYALPCSYENF